MRSTCRRCGGSGTVVKNPCRKCKGAGNIMETRKITVPVPAGTAKLSVTIDLFLRYAGWKFEIFNSLYFLRGWSNLPKPAD